MLPPSYAGFRRGDRVTVGASPDAFTATVVRYVAPSHMLVRDSSNQIHHLSGVPVHMLFRPGGIEPQLGQLLDISA